MQPTLEVMTKVSPALSYPGLFQVTGSLLSIMFRTEDVCQRCMMIVLLLFFQKQNLASTVYLFGIDTRLS